jgi:hypothetical protein
MNITVNHNEYYTNISDIDKISKCQDFFKSGCTSYAISFNVHPKYVICKNREKGFETKILKGINDRLKFVPVKYKDLSGDELIMKGINLVELI